MHVVPEMRIVEMTWQLHLERALFPDLAATNLLKNLERGDGGNSTFVQPHLLDCSLLQWCPFHTIWCCCVQWDLALAFPYFLGDWGRVCLRSLHTCQCKRGALRVCLALHFSPILLPVPSPSPHQPRTDCAPPRRCWCWGFPRPRPVPALGVLDSQNCNVPSFRSASIWWFRSVVKQDCLRFAWTQPHHCLTSWSAAVLVVSFSCWGDAASPPWSLGTGLVQWSWLNPLIERLEVVCKR